MKAVKVVLAYFKGGAHEVWGLEKERNHGGFRFGV